MYDIQLFYLLNSIAAQGRFARDLIVFTAEYLPILLVITFVIALIYVPYSRMNKLLLGAEAFFAGLFARYGIGSPIRFMWHRPRPFVVFHVHQLISETSYSFPSGHASFLFGFSSVIFFYNKKIGAWLYLISAFICFARVAAGVHYPSDILGGMIVGIIAGWITMRIIAPVARKLLFSGLTAR